MSILRAENLEIEIAGKCVCSDLDLNITTQQCWGLLGQNGVGKTTLLHTLAGLYKQRQGKIFFLDKDLSEWHRRDLAKKMAVLIQDTSDSFPATVLETALIGRHPHVPLWRFESSEDYAIANHALELVAMSELSQRDISTLSGGERQRLALATVLTQQPQLFILDEPTNHLDLHYQINLLQVLRDKMVERAGSIIMSLHDINLAARFCDHLILLFGDGEVALGPVEDMLQEEYLHRLYRHCIVKIETPAGRAFLPG